MYYGTRNKQGRRKRRYPYRPRVSHHYHGILLKSGFYDTETWGEFLALALAKTTRNDERWSIIENDEKEEY